MSLPVVFDVALGLVFIYLTLSLIASELQEILGTVFQWRAEHLKHSIESLLAGRGGTDSGEARQLADRLYASPLIRDLNYEAKGSLTRLPRRILHLVGRVYRLLTRSRNIFGTQTSGPSYIPSETFAASLLESLQLEQIQWVLTQSRLRQFIRDRISIPVSETVADLKASLGREETLTTELRHLETVLGQIFSDYQARRVNLSRTLDRVMAQLDTFAEQSAEVLPASAPYTETYLRRLHYLRRGLISQVDTAELWAQKIQPTLQDLLLLLDQSSAIYQELSRIAAQEGGNANAVLEQLQTQRLPEPLRESLLTLAERAQLKVTAVDQGVTQIQQFQAEIEGWFDRAMDRAGGVYKRNAKAVGLLVGFAIAVLINADTLYIVNRLGVDPAVRTSVIQTVDGLDLQSLDSLAADLDVGITSGVPALTEQTAAGEQTTGSQPNIDDPDADNADNPDVTAVPSADQRSEDALALTQDLKSLGQVVQRTLAEYPIPVGHTQTILDAQAAAEDSWPLPIIRRRWLGWLITGIAISMGSSFWFDALRRLVSVRASGRKPGS